MNLVLIARREDRLRKLAEDLQSEHSVSTRVVPVDLSQDDFLPVIEQATNDLQIGLLVNNAGFANTGKFLDNDLGSELALLHVNSRAPLILAHHFGRAMQECGRGGMIFVSSTVAFAGVPSWSTYAASKAQELVFAEGLAEELRQDGISVLAVCPGPTQTEFWFSRQALLSAPAECRRGRGLEKAGQKKRRRCWPDQLDHRLLDPPAAEIVERQNLWPGDRQNARDSQNACGSPRAGAQPLSRDPDRQGVFP